ncbi:hypothetical protein BKA57DRAFT_276231 [Linnemannia elongata]|nr:hypothetical protein BKA57DRAFT_276231 [Linnemannia elongata]
MGHTSPFPFLSLPQPPIQLHVTPFSLLALWSLGLSSYITLSIHPEVLAPITSISLSKKTAVNPLFINVWLLFTYPHYSLLSSFFHFHLHQFHNSSLSSSD